MSTGASGITFQRSIGKTAGVDFDAAAHQKLFDWLVLIKPQGFCARLKNWRDRGSKPNEFAATLPKICR